MSRLLSFALAALLATVVVAVLMVVSLWGFGLFDKPAPEIEAHPVEILSRSDRLDFAELFDAGRPRPPPPPPRPIEPLEIPARKISGFVQIEVETDASGRIQRMEVVNAVPAGLYEEQALAQVREMRYPPREGGGRYVEIVPFRVSPRAQPPD